MKVNDFDFSQFLFYCKAYNRAESSHLEGSAEDLLQYWCRAKNEYLWDLMGHNLILSKKFHYEADEEDTIHQMQNFLLKWDGFIDSFFSKFYKYAQISNLRYYYTDPDPNFQYWRTLRDVFNASSLIAARFDNITKPVTATINGKKYVISPNQKVMPVIQKWAETLDMAEEFEDFRIAHSQVLNQKVLSGDLCLSIHPLDYATASDNENGWTSCMSWDDEGCYRLGTVEMMNSPMVICAYLKSEVNEMRIANKPWPSKKWRAWIIVDEENKRIICNKHYPYQSQAIAEVAVEWVRDLANENLGWHITAKPELQAEMPDKYEEQYETCFMYNDIGYQQNMTVGEEPMKITSSKKWINYSGVANCMNCGNIIDYSNRDDAGTLLCPHCDHKCRCDGCGRVIEEEEAFWDPDGEYCYCSDCYYDRYAICDECGESVPVDEMVSYEVFIDDKVIETATRMFNITHRLYGREYFCCGNCMKDDGIRNLVTVPTKAYSGFYHSVSIADIRNMKYDDIVSMTQFERTFDTTRDNDTFIAFMNWYIEYVTGLINAEEEGHRSTNNLTISF